MPYIIETSRGCGYCTHCGYGDQPSAACLHKQSTRAAVATLDEAADQIERIADAWLDSVPEDDYTVETHRQYRRIIEAWHAWGESGGTVGPLPDGTVIEVRQVDRFALGFSAGLIAADHPQLWNDSDLVDKFNRTGRFAGDQA